MTEILKERWMRLANIIKEQDSQNTTELDECGDDGAIGLTVGEQMEEQRHGDDDDYVPGASAWGHSGDWEEYFDNERESGNEMANKSLRQLKDEGYSDDEILEILKDLK